MALPLLYFQFEAVGKLISLPISHRSLLGVLLFFFFFFVRDFVGPIRKRIFIFGESSKANRLNNSLETLSIEKLVEPLLNCRNNLIVFSKV